MALKFILKVGTSIMKIIGRESGRRKQRLKKNRRDYRARPRVLNDSIDWHC